MQKEDIVFETLDRLKNEIRKVIIGQDKVTEQLITGLLADGHILIEGVPGIAKTLIAKCISKSVSAGFSRIQFTPDLMPSDLVGTMVFDSVKSEFYFRKGPLFSNIILIDEINRAPAKTQSALFEVMEERQISVDGTTYPMTPPFIVYATQNPIEQEGTYRLPEAQLDRFLFKVLIDYPADNEEVQILKNYQSASASDKLSLINPVVAPSDLEVLRNKVESIYIDEKIAGYVAAIVIATRKSRDIVLGGSPRASLSIMRSAKAHAVLQGRPYVIPDDIKAVALPALRHRIILSPEKEMEGLKPDDLIRMLVDRIEVPR
ncbi:MAG: MoxR family ATPase [Ignavibacteriales bacterium]|nr:MAG: MoxR family ATPase [Ignavibacteriales bacterium]